MERTIKRKQKLKLSAERLQGMKRMGMMRYPRMHRGCLTCLNFKTKGV